MRMMWDLCAILIFRLSSVFLVQTSYVPDEYWQSLEVAHNLVFKYGYLTWEWNHGLRSYLYPSLFALLYKILDFFCLDSPLAIVLFPRLLQSCISSISDVYFLRLCKKLGCQSFWAKVAIFTNWFWYYCGSRTIVNTFETNLTIIALYYYPWIILKEKKSDVQWSLLKKNCALYSSLVALNCIIRPTAVIVWSPLVLFHLLLSYQKYLKELVLNVMLPVAFVTLFVSIIIDSWLYEQFIVSPYNFLTMNVFEGIASFYGTHPFHWYLTQGIPVVLSLHTFPFIFGSIMLVRSSQTKCRTTDIYERCYQILLLTVIFNLVVFSYIPHKEFRFILPISPMMLLIAVKSSSNSKLLSKWKYIWTGLLVLGFIIPSVVFGIFHQRGTLIVMKYLTAAAMKNPSGSSFLFLTPCHSTPLYSHIHVNVSTRFLTCNPPIHPEYRDESDEFFANPKVWLESFDLGSATHIVCFDVLSKVIDTVLEVKGFVRKKSFPHTIFPEGRVGENIFVYER